LLKSFYLILLINGTPQNFFVKAVEASTRAQMAQVLFFMPYSHLISTVVIFYIYHTMCIIIDELDSGIYEYLLGELLSVFEKNAKGQMVFTSHNLSALEMLMLKMIIEKIFS